MKLISTHTTEKVYVVGKLVLFIFALNFFLASINLLSIFDTAQTDRINNIISQLAQRPFVGLMIGVLVTAIFQSSSTTTSLVVALVAGNSTYQGLQTTLQAAIPLIMGANIGTSVTNTLVSLGHIRNRTEFARAFNAATVHDIFNILCVIIFFPLQMATDFLGKLSCLLANTFANAGGLKFTSPLKFVLEPQVTWIGCQYDTHPWLVKLTLLFFLVLIILFVFHWIASYKKLEKHRIWVNPITALFIAIACSWMFSLSEIIFKKELAIIILALSILFISLISMVHIMKSLLLQKLENLFHKYIFKTPFRSLALGCLITVIIQSSSVTTSLMVPLAGAGILNMLQVYPFTLGANVGTTITAILAALSTGQVPGVAVAFSHLLFNVLGLLLFYFHPMRSIPIFLSTTLAKKSANHRWLPFVYILVVFFIFPFICIYLF